MKKTLMQVTADNWPEDEAYSFYMDVLKGWRTWSTEGWYQHISDKEVTYYAEKVWNKESDCAELTRRFRDEIDRLDVELKEALPD